MAVTTSYLRFVLDGDPFGNWTFPGQALFPDVVSSPGGGFALAYLHGYPGKTFLAVGDAQWAEIAPHQPATQGGSKQTDEPSVAALSNGNLVVAWDHNGIPDAGLKARLITAAGDPLGDVLSVAEGVSSVYEPRAAALTSGGFAVVFTKDNGDTDVRLNRYDASGALLGTASVNTVAVAENQFTPAIASLVDGGYVVSYVDAAPAEAQIRGAIYNADGSVRRADFAVDQVGRNIGPQVVGLQNGNWAVVYSDKGWADEGGSFGITLKIFEPDGTDVTPGGFIHVNAPTMDKEFHPAIGLLSNGFIAVTWTLFGAEESVRGRIFDQDGNPVDIHGHGTGEFVIAPGLLNTGRSGVAGLDNGRMIATWSIFGPDIVAGQVSELARVSTGDDADDTITGDALRDAMSGGGGNDSLFGGAADDFLDGGAGEDIAVFAHSLDRYVVQDFRSKILVTGPEGTDLLERVEHLQFANGTLDVVDDGDPLFDTLYYLSRNPDVFAAGVDALQHYKEFGWHEGRDPNALFDTSGYLAVNTDVAAAGINPLEHYRHNGWKEGRDPSADFDVRLYLINNPDVFAAGVDPLKHYLEFGRGEGRAIHAAVGQINGDFDAQYYLFHNPDVAAAGVDARAHFNTFGWHEGRDPNAWFDTEGYLSHYADVAAAGINPLTHYHQSGWKEGRDPSAGFDTLGYLAANPDVAAAGVDPLEHFLLYGIYEGRQAVNDGAWL